MNINPCWLTNLDDALLYYMEAFCRNTGSKFADTVLRPYPWAVDIIPDDIIKASKEAG